MKHLLIVLSVDTAHAGMVIMAKKATNHYGKRTFTTRGTFKGKRMKTGIK